MVAVVLSGVVGRFIYNQIPRSLEGRELSLGELNAMRTGLAEKLNQHLEAHEVIDESVLKLSGTSDIKALKQAIANSKIPRKEKKEILGLIRQEVRLSRRIDRLHQMQRFFKYWHVAHLPFALIMLVIVIIHIAVSLIMGYKWIF
jgi:hypothetical protein